MESKILFIEGPEGVGKTPAAEAISKILGYKHLRYDFPDIAYTSDAWLGVLIASVSMYESGIRLVIERSLHGWEFHNSFGRCNPCKYLSPEFKDCFYGSLSRWDRAAVLALTTSENNLRENLAKKNDSSKIVVCHDYYAGMEVFCNILSYDVKSYCSNWIDEIVEKVRYSGF